MKRSQLKRQQSAGFSLVELLIVIVIIGILSSISVLYLISSRRAASGASASASMRVFSSAEASYSSGVGNRDYATPQDLFREDLIDPALARACNPLPVGTSNSGQVALASQPKAGFVFDVVASPPGSAPAAFTINGRPLNTVGVGRDGDRQYFVDQTGVIRVSTDPTIPADVSSTPLQ